MKAMTVIPGQPGSATLGTRPEPEPGDGDVLVDALAVGICGTDRDVIVGDLGRPPAGHTDLVLGHESLGRVAAAPETSGLVPGDLVVGVVRRPDGCACCQAGQWDYCLTGNYTERGLRGADGYGTQRWCVPATYAVPLDPALGETGVLLEPASIVAKAWDQIDLIHARAPHPTRTALIVGAGPIGLLAALFAVQRGYRTHVVDLVTTGPKPGLVEDLGATYHAPTAPTRLRPDTIIDATGLGAVVFDLIDQAAPNAVICLSGIADTGRAAYVDVDAVHRRMVMYNQVIVGSVNADLGHYRHAATALAAADPDWLQRLITRRVPLSTWTDALTHRPEDVKVVVDLTS